MVGGPGSGKRIYPQSKLDDITHAIAEGYTRQEVAKMFEVNRDYVSKVVRKSGVTFHHRPYTKKQRKTDWMIPTAEELDDATDTADATATTPKI